MEAIVEMPNMPIISFCASSIRPQYWGKMYNSLLDNKLDWEMIMVGPEAGISPGPKFKHILATVKPAQCYEIAFRAAKGELISWTADDAYYSPHAVDTIYNEWTNIHNSTAVIALRTIEDGKDITEVHRLIGHNRNSPRMAPFGVMSRQLLLDLGGYDRNFICGQSENDLVMRVLEIGGHVHISTAQAIVDHEGAHSQGTVFRRDFYRADRQALEPAWIKNGVVCAKRLFPVQPFENNDTITTVTQGQKGAWL